MIVKTIEDKKYECLESQTILDSALAANFIFEYSCKNGQCGVCKTTLIDGQIVELTSQISLSEEDKKNNKILTCCCAPKTDILIEAFDLSQLRGIDIKTNPAKITKIINHNKDIAEIVLRLPPTANFKFLEGQYVDVTYNGISRSYSIASTSKDKQITLIIKRFENGFMSDYWFNHANENDLLSIEGPKGTFFVRDISKPLLFLATGTGIAPVISMLRAIDENPDFIQSQPINVFWGNRYSDDFIYTPIFKKLNINFKNVCSRPESEWHGEVGYVQNLALAECKNITEFNVYACGSNDMIKSAKQLFIKKGLPENMFYSDAFVQSFK